jgi:hypothetical protein
MDVKMLVGDPARLFHVTPTGPVGEVVAWPTADPVVVNSTVPSVASAVVGQDFHSVVVTALAPGTSLVEVHAAGCLSYINVTVAAGVVDHLTLTEHP